MKTIKNIILMISFLAIALLGFCADFAPLKNLTAKDSLYTNSSSGNKSINYTLYLHKDLMMKPADIYNYHRKVENAIDQWFTGIWNIIPQQRKSEFADLKQYFAKPKIGLGGSAGKIFDKAVKAVPEIKPIFEQFVPAYNLAGKPATNLPIVLVPHTVIDIICNKNARACNLEGIIFVTPDLPDFILIHELGHSVGLADQYPSGLHNAKPEMAISTLMENSLMYAQSDSVTCDEADGSIFLFDCVLRLGSKERVEKGWDSICNRNKRIELCSVVDSANFIEASESSLMMPLYDENLNKISIVKAKRTGSGPMDYTEGFNPYNYFDLSNQGGNIFSKNSMGIVSVRELLTQGLTYYFMPGAEKLIAFDINKPIKNPFKIHNGVSSIYVIGGWENSVLLSSTLISEWDNTIEFLTFKGPKSRLLLRLDSESKELFDGRSGDKHQSVKRVVFKDDRILLAQSDGLSDILTLIHYEYDSYKPMVAEYYYGNELHAVRAIKEGSRGFKVGDNLPDTKGFLTKQFIDDMANIKGSFYISAYDYAKDDSKFLEALNLRLKDNSYIKQAAQAYKQYIGPLPGNSYKGRLVEAIKQDLKKGK